MCGKSEGEKEESDGEEEEEDDDDKRDSVGTVVGIDLGTTYSW